jgi:hypothetical protein
MAPHHSSTTFLHPTSPIPPSLDFHLAVTKCESIRRNEFTTLIFPLKLQRTVLILFLLVQSPSVALFLSLAFPHAYPHLNSPLSSLPPLACSILDFSCCRCQTSRSFMVLHGKQQYPESLSTNSCHDVSGKDRRPPISSFLQSLQDSKPLIRPASLNITGISLLTVVAKYSVT